jgi:FkbM family methyltransferase
VTKYSQNNEQEWIEAAITAIPVAELVTTFLEVGAYNPKVFSNTRFLVERGWYGTYVEPAPLNFAAFLEEYGDSSNITLVNAALDHTSRMVTFYESSGDAVSTTSTNHRDTWAAGGMKFRPYWLRTITWDDLLEVTTNEFSVLSLDVEGQSASLLKQAPLDEMKKLRIIIVEHDTRAEELCAYAKLFGFEMVAVNSENLVLTR